MRRAVLIGNYTFTDSTNHVSPGDTVSVYGKEYQERDGNIVYYNKYDVGTSFVVSLSVNF